MSIDSVSSLLSTPYRMGENEAAEAVPDNEAAELPTKGTANAVPTLSTGSSAGLLASYQGTSIDTFA